MTVKEKNPLILNLTNAVSSDFVANGLLCVGASPIMSQSAQEVRSLLATAKALVINIGTLNHDFMDHANAACQLANQFNVPIIIDPVGVGATEYRTTAVRQLLHEYKIALIRGNASEIMSLAGEDVTTKGVDSNNDTSAAHPAARSLATEHKAVIVISGKTDVVVDSNNTHTIEGGSPLMPMVTGSGCLLTAIVAAFCAVNENHFNSAIDACTYYGKCGAIAETKSQGPGSFRVNFLDALYNER